jgi:YARHG domain
LGSYLNIDWPWHPLLYLKKYLADQVGGTLRQLPDEEKEPPPQLPTPVYVSPTEQPTASYPGELYPQTRQRLLTMAEIDALGLAQLRYAINEMYARHGAAFPSQPPIEAQYRKFPWYHPNPTLTFDQIEASFSEVEKENILLLGQARERKRR